MWEMKLMGFRRKKNKSFLFYRCGCVETFSCSFIIRASFIKFIPLTHSPSINNSTLYVCAHPQITPFYFLSSFPALYMDERDVCLSMFRCSENIFYSGVLQMVLGKISLLTVICLFLHSFTLVLLLIILSS